MKSDSEVSEEENENVTMHSAEKMTDRGMRDRTERNLKKRKRNNVKDDALSRCENKREHKKRKIEKDNVVVTQSKGKKSQGPDADKIKLVACSREVKDDGDEKTLMDDIEETEKERKAEKIKRKKDKREQKILLNGEEMDKETKAEKKRRKKDKRDCMVLSVDKETEAKKKKKKIEKDNVVVTQSKEKKRKRKDIKGDALAGHKEHNKQEGEHENKKEEVKKRKKNKVLVCQENEREIKKKKKEKRDHTMLLGDEETKVQNKKSKKNKERDDVEVAGIEAKRVERKTKKMRDDMKTHNREKKREGKDFEFEDDVVADLEEQHKLQHENENKKSFSPSDSLKSLIDSAGGLIQGKRFSEEENEMVKKAVFEYIEVKKLGKEGLDMVLECRSESLVRGCWQEIGHALPWRPYRSVYQRARRLFIRGDSKWTAEDVQHLRKSYEKYGPKWKKIADELGKNSCHVRNAFQFYRFGNLNKGKWSQHEYQTLFELVNKDLQINVLLEKRSCHGMLRDNIKWESISWKIGTRHNLNCCGKWYRQLTSSMVVEGIWADADDYSC